MHLLSEGHKSQESPKTPSACIYACVFVSAYTLVLPSTDHIVVDIGDRGTSLSKLVSIAFKIRELDVLNAIA
jgi:hypothetical protein